MKKFFQIMGTIIILTLCSSSAQAITTTFYPSHDTYLNGFTAGINQNYGAYPTLRFAQTATSYYLMMFTFPLDTIPVGETIHSAKFRLYFRQMLDNSNLAAGTMKLSPIGRAWDQATVTWVGRPSKVPSIDHNLEVEITNTEPGYQEWDITSLVQLWIDNPEQNFGFYVEPMTYGFSSGFDSSEGQFSPELTVQYGFTLASITKPVITLIPGLINPDPEPEPEPTPTPTPVPDATPQTTSNPTAIPTASPSPTSAASPAPNEPTVPPAPTTQPVNHQSETASVKISNNTVSSPKPSLLIIWILGLIALLCFIGSLIIIKLIQKGGNHARPRNTKSANRKRSK